MSFEEARPELLAFGTSQLAGNDALHPRACAELGVRVGSEVEKPGGMRVQSEVRCRDQEPGAVVGVTDRHSPGPATASTRGGQEAN